MFLRRTLPLIIAFISGLIGVALNFSQHQTSLDMQQVLSKWLIIIFGFAAYMGIYGLLSMHVGKMKRKAEGWGYSAVMLLGFFLMLWVGVYNGGAGFWSPKAEGTMYDWLYEYVYTPSQATMFASLAFFIASAAYRSFRAKTREAALLLVAAVIVMLGQVPISESVSPTIPVVSNWLLSFPNMAVKRAIFFGICLGTISTSIRIIFGIERAYLGGE